MDERALPKYNGKDFVVWKTQVKALLDSKDLSHVLDGVKPETVDGKRLFESNDRKAKSIILLALETRYVKQVLGLETAKEIWNRLLQSNAQKSQEALTGLQTQFYGAKLEREESVADYFTRVTSIVSQMSECSCEMSEANVMGKIVDGLPKVYNSFKSSWIATSPQDKTLNKLYDRLLAEETMLGITSQFKDGVALNAQSKSKKNTNKKKKRLNPKALEKFKANSICRFCKEKGHWKTDCPKIKKQSKDDESKDKHEDEASTAIIAEVNFSNCQSEEWVLDTGVSEHMTNQKSSMKNIKVLDEPKLIRFGDGRFGKATAIGEIDLQPIGNGGKKVTMKNVLYVPSLHKELISLSAITDKGNIGVIETDRIIIKGSKNDILFVANKKNKLYYVALKELNAYIASTSELPDINVWHKRFCHVNRRYLLSMSKNDSVIGLPAIKPNFKKSILKKVDCDACQLGKQPRMFFPLRSGPRATQVGARIHIDICGPINEPTSAGSRYFFLAKDEFSCYRFIYFMKTKDQAFDCIKKVVAQLKGDTGNDVRTIVSDKGSEIVSKKTTDFLLEKSIAQEICAPYTPAQNGFIERENRTIMEATRSCLFECKAPQFLWGEAANSAVYVLNRTINSKSDMKTPFEMYFKRKPRVDNLRIFGSLAYVKLQEKKRSGYQKKLEESVEI